MRYGVRQLLAGTLLAGVGVIFVDAAYKAIGSFLESPALGVMVTKSDFLASDWTVAGLVSRHLDDNDSTWPRNSEQLEPAFNQLYCDAGGLDGLTFNSLVASIEQRNSLQAETMAARVRLLRALKQDPEIEALLRASNGNLSEQSPIEAAVFRTVRSWYEQTNPVARAHQASASSANSAVNP